jgi:PAS domain S-box-containing protein
MVDCASTVAPLAPPEEEPLREFVENALVPMQRVGPDGTILWANRAQLELLGYTRAEYLGRRLGELLVEPDAAPLIARLAAGEDVREVEARLRARDGSMRDVHITSSAYRRDGALVHTRCFIRDVTESRRAARQVEAITDALPVLVSYIDREGRYRFVSAAYERWFGHRKEEILGERIVDVLGPAAFEAVRPYMERAFAGETVSFEREVPYRDGGARYIQGTYIPQRAEDGAVEGYVALIADATERKTLERFRAEAVQRSERLLEITTAIAGAVTTAEVLEAVVDRVAEAVGASSAGLFLVEEDGRALRLARALGYPGGGARLAAMPLDSSPAIPALDVARTGEPLWFPSQAALLAAYPHLAGAVTPGRAYRVAVLPLSSQGRVLGSLALTLADEREVRDDERSFLLVVARHAGQALERVRLLEAERRSRTEADAAAARLGVLSRASRAFVEAPPGEVIPVIVRELGTALDSSVGLTLLRDDGRLHPVAVHHPVEAAQELLWSIARASPVEIGSGITGRVARTGESVLVARAEPAELLASAAPGLRVFLERHPIYAVLCAPLRARGRVIGVVIASRTRPGETYAREDLELFEELADRAASAIENGRLHRENVRARARAEQLYRFAQAVVSADRVEETLEAALDAIERALGVERAAILLTDEAGVMRFRAWRNLSDEYRQAVEGHSPWPPGASAPRPVLVSDVTRDPELAAFLPLFRREGIGALAFVPLVTRGQLSGKLVIYHPGPRELGETEVEVASAIAGHLASVNARFAAVARLEQTIRENELLAGVLAHDLRNPLGAIMTAAQLMLMRADAGERSARPLGRILASGQRMTRMIDQLLDFTRARVGGGIQVHRHDLSLGELCGQVIGELELAFPDLQIELEVAGDPAGSWDPDRLQQVISNLVANAGQHGEPEAGVRVRVDGRRADSVFLEVHNQGAIPPALLPTLFDPFSGARARRAPARGLGLGLYIVKELVRAHGGVVDVVSTPADGTTFTVALPRQGPSSLPPPPTQPHS